LEQVSTQRFISGRCFSLLSSTEAAKNVEMAA
jgi:hypothetical protein